MEITKGCRACQDREGSFAAIRAEIGSQASRPTNCQIESGIDSRGTEYQTHSDEEMEGVETKSIFSVVQERDSVVRHQMRSYDGKDELN